MEKRLTVPLLLLATLLLGNGIISQASEAEPEFLFVHGAFHGAWCWYKVVTLLQAAGYKATALDMTSDGRDKTNADTVTSLAQFTKPLTDYLANNVTGKVVLVGHSLGGVSITYAMEQHPEKISKAIFLAALMPLNNQSLFSSTPPEVLPRVLAAGDIFLNYANGPTVPTSVSANLSLAENVFYNQSPTEDVTLALTLLDKEPYVGFVEVLILTPARYGSIRRFFIKTDLDHVFTQADFTYIINQNPPEQTYFISGSDHSAFFSRPLLLVSRLLNIATL